MTFRSLNAVFISIFLKVIWRLPSEYFSGFFQKDFQISQSGFYLDFLKVIWRLPKGYFLGMFQKNFGGFHRFLFFGIFPRTFWSIDVILWSLFSKGLLDLTIRIFERIFHKNYQTFNNRSLKEYFWEGFKPSKLGVFKEIF